MSGVDKSKDDQSRPVKASELKLSVLIDQDSADDDF